MKQGENDVQAVRANGEADGNSHCCASRVKRMVKGSWISGGKPWCLWPGEWSSPR